MFGADAAICGICRYHDDCGVAAKATLARLATVIDVGNVGIMHVCTKTALPKAVKIAAAPSSSNAKVNKLVSQILKAAPDAQAHFYAGTNPFDVSAKPPYLKPLIDILFSSEPTPERMRRLLVTVFLKSEKEAEALLTLTLSAIDVIKATNEETL